MKNVFLNVRTAKAQAGCAKLKDTSLSFRRGLGRGFLFTFLLLTLGVGQMWADKVTVKFKFAAGQTAWTKVNAYTWGEGESGDWPGHDITSSLSDGWYSYSLTKGCNIIFNNGSGTQSGNIEGVQEDVCYVWVDNTDKAKEDLNCDGVIDGTDTRYYYRGTSNSWGATAMTPHGSGLYSYIGTYTKNNEFKISLSSGGWDYGWSSNVHDNTFNGGVSDGLVEASGNYKINTSSSVYIIVYYPNTSLNNTNKPKINVRTSLYNPSYTITLDKNGGSSNGSASVTYNATSLSSISAPTRTGYDVEGYYANSICTTKVATPAGALQASTTYTDASKKWTSASNQTLYTKWTPKTYNITYKDQGNVTFSGVHEEGYPTTHTYGTATALDSPTKDGYIFGGWYTNSTCTTSAGSSIGATSKTADFTLYAKWTEKTYSLTFSHNGHGTIKVGGSTVSSGSTASVNHITTKALVAEASSGYHFTGWTISGTNNDKVTIADKTSTGTSTTIKATAAGATVTAGFAADAASYTITYDAGNSPYNNGSVSESHSYASGSSQTSGTVISLTATPTNSHYKLEGWYSDAACTSAIAGAGTSNPYEFTLGDNTSVYAKFVLKTCAITLNRNGATAGAESVTARHGETLSSFIAHSLADYTLQGYYTTASGGTKIIDANGAFVASTTYANVSKQWDNDATALTLYAQLAQTITLDANTANHGSGDNTSATATYNGTSPVSGFSATSAATGYQLEGYYSDPTSGVKVLNSNGTYASDNVTGYITSGKWTKSGATTLYAHLTAKTYSITLNANDGSSGGSATATYNSNKLTSITAPSKSGYDIMGYYKEPGCTNLIADASGNLQAGTTYTDASGNWTSNSSQTLYPKWGLQLPAALQLDGQLSGGWDNCKLMNKSDRLFSYTVYSVSAGTYEFCFKNGSCGSTALLKPNMSICNSKKNAGNITWEDAGGEYHNFRITTTSEGDVTITVEYGETTALVTVNHTSVPSISSGWFLRGDPFEGWNSDNNSYPFNRSYRGIDGVYYRVFDFAGQTDKWFKPCKGTNEYGQSTGADINISENTQYLVVKDKSGDNTSFKPNGLHQVWCIIDENSNKFWVQSPDAYYTMSVTSDHGTVTLTENVYGNLQTNQFEAGETVNISVSAASGYWIDDIELNGTPLVTDRNSGSWSGSTTMPAGNATLTVTYNRYYTLTYDANYYKSETGGTAPSASSYVSGSNVTVVGKGDLTMTNYTFSGWNTDPHITGTNYAEGANIEMTGNITLYGVWKRTIPFELEDADPEFVMATVYGTYNCTTLTDYDNPTKDGYTFGGWWTNIAGGDNYVISPEKELQHGVYHWTNYDNKTNEFMRYPTSISSLYAKWTQTVTLNPNLANHGLGDNTSATIVYKATGKTSITHCTPATGYHLVGYYTAATDGVKVLNADGSFAESDVTDYITEGKWTKAGATTLYAHYEGNTYTVTLAPNGGSGSNQTVTATYDAAMPPTLSGGGAIVAPNKTGYAFGGYWYESTQYYAANLSSVTNWNRTSATTLNAKWTPKQSALTFDYQTSAEGYGTSGSIAAVSATYGAAMPALTGNMPTAAQGYAFMGFYSETGGNGTLYYNPDKTSAHNWDVDTESTTTLYAYYKKSEITAVVLNHDIFEPVAEATGDDNKDYVFANPTIAPRPTPTTKLCWELRYSNDNPVAGDDYRAILVSGDQVKFKLVGLAAGGYKIHVELRTGSECGAGTLLSSYDKSFSIASKHIVTIQYKSGDFTLKASTNVDGKPLAWSEVIEAASITGYTFNHWEAGEGVTIKDDEGEDKTTSTDATIQIKAIYDSKLTALYTKKNMIYFYNTLGWDTVFVYFYENGNYWSDTYGTGANQYQNWGGQNPYWFGEHGGMKRVAPGSDIWYFDYTEAGYETRANVVFADKDQSKQVDCAGDNACIFFSDNAKVARRSDHNSSLPMFVPLSNQTGVNKNENRAKYYSDGYWMNYPENTGYTLKLYSSQDATTPTRTIRFPFSADTKMPLKLDVELNEAATNYYYTIYREDGQVLSASYGMNKNHHTNVRLNSPSTKISIKTTAPGIYKYSLVYMNNSGTKDYYISVDYPIVENDYRISYSDNATWSQGSAHTSGWYHPSDVIRKNTDAEVTQYDTVSFYISKGAGITASMKFQYAKTIVEAGTITWQDVTGGGINAADTISKAGVYNFIIKQEGTAKPVVEKVEPYTGNYYIRTDGAGSTKWDYYRSSDHQMTYTEFSMSDANSFGEKYSHYFAAWCIRGTNIKFCIANDYSSCISDTLSQDVGNPFNNTDLGGTLKSDGAGNPLYDRYSANVRFMYNQETNKISRAYVASSTNASRLFLVLRGNQVIKGEDGSTAINDQSVTNGAILSDKENWIYERILYINPGTRFKLFACYAEATPTEAGAQYFRGAYDSDQFTSNANSVILISGTGSYQKARVLYDFKTNRLVCAWLPSDDPIGSDLDIDADVMVIRDHQEAAECITFSGSGKLTEVKTVYGAMKFNRWTLNNRYRGKGGVEDNNKDHCDSPADIAEYHGILPAGEQKSVYERSLYFISFPFDVKVSEIFGFGTYGKHWVLEYYDGLNRAKNGYWIDSPANWKYVTPSMAKTYELKAYEGYILCLSLGRMAYDNTEVWPNNISNVELYFPSKTPMTNIQKTNVTIPGLSDEYQCTINRGTPDGDRRIKDSYWRCLGVPSYDMYAGTLTSDGSTVINWQTDYSTFPFLYAWNMTDNTLTPQSTNRFSFKPMHAYLTQIGTPIYWTNVSATPASVMARQTEEPTEYNWCLTLNAGEQMIDQTYIRMSTDEHITNEFDFGQDLAKELNAGRSDIYSFIGYERAAANSMQMNTETTTIVPLGLNIEATGEYTFSIPDGTNGIGITLIDEETGIRTSLSALDYTVELAAGDYTERFWLEISPVKGAETGIDPGVDEHDAKIRKVMIDGILYIIRDGKMYDARGARVE